MPPIGRPPSGVIDHYFLPGQGRDLNSPTAVIRHVPLFDEANRSTMDENPLPSPMNIQLDRFNVQNRTMTAQMFNNPNSRHFPHYRLQVSSILIERQNGLQEFPGFTDTFLDEMVMTVFPGRISSLPVFLNDSHIFLDPATNRPTFNRDKFLEDNRNRSTNKITAFVSDMLAFDIRQVPNKPLMMSEAIAGQEADMVYVSGDVFALSRRGNQAGTEGDFEILTPFGVHEGRYARATGNEPRNTYTLLGNDPRFLFPPRTITDFRGLWFDYTEVIQQAGEVEFITFPRTGDGPQQDLVVVQRNLADPNRPIVAMWFGQVDYSATPQPTFKAYPINQIQPASVANELTGRFDITKMVGATGAVNTNAANWWQNVRSGDYIWNTPPAGLPAVYASGRFVVYRN